MFDILDSNLNLTNLSISPGTRSGSMQKIQKKQNRPSMFQESKLNPNQNKGFDDLINGFLEKQSKMNVQSIDNVSRATSRKGNFDSLDFNFDQIGKHKSTNLANSSVGNSFTRPVTAKNYNELDLGNEDHKLTNHFGKTQQTIFNPSKIQESFVSTRQMKPPIKKRDNMSYMSGNIFNSQIGMTIPQEDPTISNSSNEYPGAKASRSINRRSSIDARSELNMDDSFSIKNQALDNPISFKMDKIKEESLEKMSNTESHLIGWGHNDTGFKFGSNFNKNDHNSTIKSEKPQKQEKSLQSAVTQAEINERIAKSNKSIIQDYEKQIQLIKINHKRQNDFLQQNLDKQIAENKQMRQKFIKQSGRMIDQERSRSKRIQEEEIGRLKDMFEWQKKKITQAYKCQISSLKSFIDFKKENSSSSKNVYNESFEKENMQRKYKLWQSSLQEKAQMLERRQLNLQESINQINSQKMQDDQKIRREERRLLELQMNHKKQMLTQKKELAEEKQKMSMELGNLELQIIKRKEANQIEARRNQIERQSLEKQRDQLRKMSQEIMQAHKINIDQVQEQRQKISYIELQLLKKLRIVELKAQQTQFNRNNEEEINYMGLDLNKSKQKESLVRPIRKMSKDLNTKSMLNLQKTKERFCDMEMNARSKMDTSFKNHKKLDLGHYMSRIQHFSKGRP